MTKLKCKKNTRKLRVRYALKKRSDGRLRLSIHRTSQNIYAQVIDDAAHVTLCATSSIDPALKGKLKGTKTAAAEMVGEMIAKAAVKLGHTEVVFDRGAYIYHGRIKALADSARAHGLKF